MLEEPLDRYCPGRYHPVKLGDVYNNRYEVVRKLGWGLYSTVWLAKEDRANRHVALKILVADAFASTMTTSNGNLKHRHSKTTSCGKSTACKQTILDANMYPNFSTSSSIQDPTAHTSASCGIIHTDIKPSNILLEASTPYPELQRVDWIQHYFDNVPVPTGVSYPDFDHVRSMPIFVPVTEASTINIQLADFGSACWEDKRLSDVIQPDLLRAPEVICRLPWSTGVDIWSAGVVIYELMVAKRLFDGDTLNNHLQEMVSLLGPFPQEFINQVSTRTREQFFTSDGYIKDAAEYRTVTLEIV
ncbi:MAG: hypothetical protein L6R40_007957 [Gallowayella cf. fulva]|nr:MAG: hypothetical protein L6R40_007957 [Xanthomendoza cf. fulva]